MPSNGVMQGGQSYPQTVAASVRDPGYLVVQANRARENADRLESLCSSLTAATDRVFGPSQQPPNPISAGPEKIQMASGAMGELAAVNDRTDHLLNWLSALTEKVNGIA